MSEHEHLFPTELIYLDNAATTSCDPRVVEAMVPIFMTQYGNPSSSHVLGRQARALVEEARYRLLHLLARGQGHIVFTSGATESNNCGVHAAVRLMRGDRQRGQILCLSTEHKSLWEPLRVLAGGRGIEVLSVPVDPLGRIDMDDLMAHLSDRVGAVFVQLANSETGVIQNVAEVAAAAHRFGAWCISDVTQAVGKIPVDFRTLGVDMATFNGHKIHGPKGVGALYTAPGIRLEPLLWGGGQERYIRAGTENVASIVGMAKAIEIALELLDEESSRIETMRNRLWEAFSSRDEFGETTWNGRGARMLPTHLNVTFHGIKAQEMMLRVPTIALSAGSACNALTNKPSEVLSSMGLSTDAAEETIRFSLSRYTRQNEIVRTIKLIGQVVEAMTLDEN